MIGQRGTAVFPFGGPVGLRRIVVRTGFVMLRLSGLRDLGVFPQVEGQLIEAFRISTRTAPCDGPPAALADLPPSGSET